MMHNYDYEADMEAYDGADADFDAPNTTKAGSGLWCEYCQGEHSKLYVDKSDGGKKYCLSCWESYYGAPTDEVEVVEEEEKRAPPKSTAAAASATPAFAFRGKKVVSKSPSEVKELVEQLQAVLGADTFKEGMLTSVLASQRYDVEATINWCLENNGDNIAPPPAPCGGALFTETTQAAATRQTHAGGSGGGSSTGGAAMSKKQGKQQQAVTKAPIYKLPPVDLAKQKKRAEQAAEEEAKDGKSQLNMVVVGHVDAGKSTLMGQMLWRLGQVDQRTMHKYEKLSREAGKASFALAWVMDADEEERAKGVTMDVGMGQFTTEHHSVTILDAPGHKDFVPKMIAGAAQADVAVLVVPAIPTEFDSSFRDNAQTKEHTRLIRSLGVALLIVAVNKMDHETVKWSEQQFESIKHQVGEFAVSAGFKANKVNETECPYTSLHLPTPPYTSLHLPTPPPRLPCLAILCHTLPCLFLAPALSPPPPPSLFCSPPPFAYFALPCIFAQGQFHPPQWAQRR
jgi:signal recognition particle receptor subunit beta